MLKLSVGIKRYLWAFFKLPPRPQEQRPRVYLHDRSVLCLFKPAISWIIIVIINNFQRSKNI